MIVCCGRSITCGISLIGLSKCRRWIESLLRSCCGHAIRHTSRTCKLLCSGPTHASVHVGSSSTLLLLTSHSGRSKLSRILMLLCLFVAWGRFTFCVLAVGLLHICFLLFVNRL